MVAPSSELAALPNLLEGLVVLDFTRVLAGPHATRTLADLGARVIKIERPGEGDEMRRAPAPLPGEGDQSTYFSRRNAGKESVAVNLSLPSGQAVIHDLAKYADIAVENFMPGVADKLNCGFEAIRATKPDIVYCSISGYGQTGPSAKQGAFAHVVSAASGIMHLDAREGDSGYSAPGNSHLQAADVLAGSNAVGAILAAIVRRGRTGEGAHIDVSMLESLIASEDISYGSVPNGAVSTPGPRAGMGLSQIGDRWVAWQSGGAPTLWPRLCNAMKQPGLVDDARFATGEARRDNWPEMQALVSQWLRTFADLNAALDALRHARIPCAPVNTPEEVVRDPQLEYRDTFHTLPHPGGGEVKVTSSPFWIDGKPVPPRGPAPYRIGEDTRRVLSGLLNYDSRRIAELLNSGAISEPDST
jgi:CoA:oxalate CoA-transferase